MSSLRRTIADNRKLLQNPYAHLDDTGDFNAIQEISSASIDQIAASRQTLQNPYAHIDGEGNFTALAKPPCKRAQDLSTNNADKSNSIHSFQIEKLAREYQINIWKKRHQLWPDGVPSDPVDLLDPSIALELIGFQFGKAESLGQFTSGGSKIEVAGIIDQSRKKVTISRQLPFNTQRFTTAHELGHALMHQGTSLHRDRPIDGSPQSGPRERIEYEADKFAACFLMPKKLLTKRFSQMFGCNKFILNEATAFALGSGDLEKKCVSLRDLARILAKTESYNGRYFHSLAKQFHVSIEAMAIRIEELALIEIPQK